VDRKRKKQENYEKTLDNPLTLWYNIRMNNETETIDNSSFSPRGNYTISEEAVFNSLRYTDNKVKTAIMRNFFDMGLDFQIDALTSRQCSDVFIINTLFAMMDRNELSYDDVCKEIQIPVKYHVAFQKTLKDINGTPTTSDLNTMFGME
tara:strand:- start:562 stop:1008 length:447 start_codon:yes stop_codon:yes gene_type:complete